MSLRQRVRRPGLRFLSVVAVALLGGVLGISVGGQVREPVGPVNTVLEAVPSLNGDTTVRLAPLGALRMDTHDGPLSLSVAVTQLRPADARRIVRSPQSLDGLGTEVQRDLHEAVRALVVRCLLAGTAGAALLALLVFRRWRPVAAAGGIALALLTGSGAVAAGTWRPQALAEPQYTGLLTSAPAVVGDARSIVNRFAVYRQQLAKIVTNVGQLYLATSTLPVLDEDASTVQVLHVSDVHLNPAGFDVIRSLVRQLDVDVVADTGDLTDHGSAAENVFVSRIGGLGVPYVYVRGNHDSAVTAAAVARQRNAVVLDGTAATVGGVRFFGVGDPRFTPDKRSEDDTMSPERLREVGAAARLRLLGSEPPVVQIALAHDPAIVRALDGAAPVLLAGHTHRREATRLDESLLIVQGSTGGAGLRALEGDEPTPIQCSVLHLDRGTGQLRAYDDVEIGGLGLTSVQITRRIVEAVPAGSTAATGTR